MKARPKSAGGSFLELVVIVVVALGLALLIQAFLVKPFRIPSASMRPTLVEGQRILVSRIGERLGDPELGDIIVFHPPKGADTDECGNRDLPASQICDAPTEERSDQNFVKRVIAGPGDRLRIVDGQVFRNGQPLREPYARPCESGPDCSFTGEITIPEDAYFMMGDNRGASDDSRSWGPIKREWIIGRAFATYWPPKRIGSL